MFGAYEFSAPNNGAELLPLGTWRRWGCCWGCCFRHSPSTCAPPCTCLRAAWEWTGGGGSGEVELEEIEWGTAELTRRCCGRPWGTAYVLAVGTTLAPTSFPPEEFVDEFN